MADKKNDVAHEPVVASVQAKVKADNGIHVVRAFGGLVFVRNEWRQVPAGAEDEAKRHDMLDWRPSRSDAGTEDVKPADQVETDETSPAFKSGKAPAHADKNK